MTPLQSPTSPTFAPSHPATPLSPSFNHPLDSHMSPPVSPRLSVVTTFPFHTMSLRNSPILGHFPRSATLKPVHRRNDSSVSTLSSFPSPAEALFNHIPATPKTPLHYVPFETILSPGAPIREDGRQSRMAMHSPIVERILSLPLRVNTSSRTASSESRFPNPPNTCTSFETTTSSYISTPSSAMSLSSPYPPPTPTIHISAPPPPRNTTSTTSTTHRRPHSPTLASTLTSHHPNNSPFPTPAHRQAYHTALTHLSTPLVPLISVTTGLPHPSFPRSLLQYHLLTHQQLDSLALWYHQTHPACKESWMYPAYIPPYTSTAAAAAAAVGRGVGEEVVAMGFEDVSLTTKRRRWGRFIGLRGCESPTETGQEEDGGESLVERMEREWARARERAREEEMMREKSWRGRW